MSLLRTLDRTSVVSISAQARSLCAFPCAVRHPKSSCRSFSKSAVTRRPRLSAIPATPIISREHMDNFFIQALARAASCPEHAKQIAILPSNMLFSATHHRTRRKSTLHTSEEREWKQHKVERGGPFRRVRQFAERELKALVDYYGVDLAAPMEEDVLDDGPLIWNVGDDHVPWPARSSEDTRTITKLEDLLKDEETPHQDIFNTYKMLPAPGVVYLCTETIRTMLHHLSILERPTPIAMQRFLAILDDMKNAHIHIIRSEWTTAIYLAGRFMGKVTGDEVQSALYIWRDMEKRAGVLGGTVTLNVLFDVAVKAGKYTLAETFLKELEARKLLLHRHFRVSLLYYYGIMQNGSAIRRTYRELVESGDVVDTVVMNAVIAALIRAGEPAAAEHVFERMKRLHATKVIPLYGVKHFNSRNWRQRRALGLHLTHEARALTRAQDEEQHKVLQDSAPIAPDSRTYGLLIRYYASTAGNIDRVSELIREMGYNGVPLNGTIFIVILHGFNKFGGVRYSSWTRNKLEQTWSEYLNACQIGLDRTWLSKMAVVSALKAFAKCADRERVLKAWEEVRELWEPEPSELEAVMRTLRKLVPQHTFFDHK